MARAEGSRMVAVIAASRELSGFSLSLESSAIFFSGGLDGGASTLFGSALVSPLTSFSIAPAREMSCCDFVGMLGSG